MRPALRYVVLAPAALVLSYFGIAWIWDALRSDESRVRLVLEDVEKYARQIDAGGVLEYLDPEYRDAQGFTAPEVRRVVHGYFMNAESVEAELEPVGIDGLEVEGNEADVLVRAHAVVKLPGGEAVGLDEAGMQGDYFVVRLRRHGSFFRARSVRPARPDELPGRDDFVDGTTRPGRDNVVDRTTRPEE